MTETIIQSLWIGDNLSNLERLSIASFLANGHSYHLYIYNEVKGVPNRTIIKDANSIIPEFEIFAALAGYAIFSDWFRWELLYKTGNYWVDTDNICLRPFDFVEDIVFGKEEIDIANNGVLKFPAKHEFCRFMSDIAEDPNKLLPYDTEETKAKKLKRRSLKENPRANVGWGEAAGPLGFTAALKYFGLFDIGKPSAFFHPIHWSKWKSVFDEKNDVNLFSDTYSIHLWNEYCRREPGFDKDASFPKSSLFEQLKRKYLINVLIVEAIADHEDERY